MIDPVRDVTCLTRGKLERDPHVYGGETRHDEMVIRVANSRRHPNVSTFHDCPFDSETLTSQFYSLAWFRAMGRAFSDFSLYTERQNRMRAHACDTTRANVLRTHYEISS